MSAHSETIQQLEGLIRFHSNFSRTDSSTWLQFLFNSLYVTGFASKTRRDYIAGIGVCKLCGDDFDVTCDPHLCNVCGDSPPYTN